jgi:peptidoglycan/xylan/chitin deacetylase (PgdA/CDA1 family)
MSNPKSRWPAGLDPNTLCFSVDVEWSAPEVIEDLRALFDEHRVQATFFVTHGGVSVPGHERGLHPNFRRDGDTYRKLDGAATRSDAEVSRHVVATTLSFAPEAKGVRAHSLRYDSSLLPLYRESGIEYESSYRLPLVGGLRPFWNQHDIVGIPAYYADYFDLVTGATGYTSAKMQLDQPGLKVLDFHPNLVYLNTPDEPAYMASKAFYHQPEKLLAARHPGRGVRTLLLEILEEVGRKSIPTATLGRVNELWRSVPAWF